MPRVRDVLHRFRPSGAPGAATASGVPVDRAGELAAELEPVLALLEETEQECAAELERAGLEAAATRARDAERVAAVLASGRARVEAERASAAARSRAEGRPDSPPDGGVSGPPGRPGHVDEQRLAPFVDLVVDSVVSLLAQGARAAQGADPLGGAR